MEERRGLALGASAYVMWGLFPLYWPLLEPAGAIEILAHRVLWSVITVGLLMLALRRTSQLRALLANPRQRMFIVLASVVIAINWGTFIWAVNHDHVVETSLGYFINPLVTVLMGVLILQESLRPLQWASLGLAAAAVVVLTVDYGRPPWVALALAGSFGVYGLAKKQAGAGAVESLALETAVMAPVALAYVVFVVVSGNSHFGTEGVGHAALLALTGVVTAVPLLCFGAAATRLPMVMLGLLQYLAPILQFVIGVWIFHEAMPSGRWIGFGLVWIALVAFTFEAVNHRRRQLRLAVEASAL
ncbi:EamA family transporter RarD [Nocardioides alcanivorans]|uniref:EamA family transporter RarD n=1 Tax=Nocardioides alcanivorans TaxID=2897352 RepID=UPI001F26C295|nr:EamA family transporter RarD [Nocardioides alcanivorans]